MKRFDIAPFALPNGPAGELKFEDPRDVAREPARDGSSISHAFDNQQVVTRCAHALISWIMITMMNASHLLSIWPQAGGQPEP
jgi:hypothetical protein